MSVKRLFLFMVVYIIYSPSIDKYYVGQTQYFEERLRKHNLYNDKTSFTSHNTDWQEYLLIPCETRQQALKIEAYIKKQKSRKFIERLKQNPARVSVLISKFKPSDGSAG